MQIGILRNRGGLTYALTNVAYWASIVLRCQALLTANSMVIMTHQKWQWPSRLDTDPNIDCYSYRFRILDSPLLCLKWNSSHYYHYPNSLGGTFDVYLCLSACVPSGFLPSMFGFVAIFVTDRLTELWIILPDVGHRTLWWMGRIYWFPMKWGVEFLAYHTISLLNQVLFLVWS